MSCINKRKDKGFTLIETVTVVVIVGILIRLAVPVFRGYIVDARIISMQTDIDILEDITSVYMVDNVIPPGDIADEIGIVEIIGSNDTSILSRLNENKYSKYIRSITGDLDDYGIVKEGKHIGRVFHLNGFQNKGGELIHGIKSDVVNTWRYTDEEIQALIDEGYVPIATADELDSLRNEELGTFGKGTKWENAYLAGKDKGYVQVSNVNLSTIENFMPIGGNDEMEADTNSFYGIYDGGGFIISNLKVNAPDSDYVGLFGKTTRATIRNVGLINSEISGYDFTGGLVGHNQDSEIHNCFSTGNVKGNKHTGGLVGKNHRSAIDSSYSKGNVYGRDYVGGLIGRNDLNNISNSYSTSDVSGKYWYIGGLIGWSETGVVSNSFSKGEVNGHNGVGGLVGCNYNNEIKNSYSINKVVGSGDYVGGLAGDNIEGGLIESSYSVGKVVGSDYYGGLVGRNESSEIQDSYYNEEVYGMIDDNKGSPLSTEEMKKQSSYNNWDFDEIWKIKRNEYPMLR